MSRKRRCRRGRCIRGQSMDSGITPPRFYQHFCHQRSTRRYYTVLQKMTVRFRASGQEDSIRLWKSGRRYAPNRAFDAQRCRKSSASAARQLCQQRLCRSLASVTALPYSWSYCPLPGPSIPIPTNPPGVASQFARNHLKRRYLQALYLDVSMLSSVEGASRLLCSGSRT
jgi:hypothetical protein